MKIKGDGDKKLRVDSIPIYGDTLKKLAIVQKAHPDVKGKSSLWNVALKDSARLYELHQEFSTQKVEFQKLRVETEELNFTLRHFSGKVDALEKSNAEISATNKELIVLMNELIKQTRNQ